MRAPEPQLSVGVRQGGQPVTGELNVNPGTALNMDVYLDKASAPIYGLLVSYMQVTDTKNQEETIIFNGYVWWPRVCALRAGLPSRRREPHRDARPRRWRKHHLLVQHTDGSLQQKIKKKAE